MDVSGLPADERVSVLERLDGYAFLTSEHYEKGRGLVAITVYWDSSEDFTNSPLFPHGCPCREA